MHYFIPDIRLAGDGLERLGGVPHGLPAARWPVCAECGKAQSPLAQFLHDDVRLDLGRAGRVLYAFQCDRRHDCDSWRALSGANACFVLEPDELVTGTTPLPAEAPPLGHAIAIAGWREQDDDIAPERLDEFLDAKKFFELGEMQDLAYRGTKLGGIPGWVQFPETPGPGFRFLGQLGSWHRFPTPPESPPDWVSLQRTEDGTRAFVGEGPKFGDSGTAYLFLKQGTLDGAILWQGS